MLFIYINSFGSILHEKQVIVNVLKKKNKIKVQFIVFRKYGNIIQQPLHIK